MKRIILPPLLPILLVCLLSIIFAVLQAKDALTLYSPSHLQSEKSLQVLHPPSFYFKKSWPDGRVIYEISRDFNKSQKASILNAMENLSLKTCITFKERSSQPEYLLIKMNHGAGCRTEVDRYPGKVQTMTLDPSWCLKNGRILHELLHALGFTHEHQRPDRDKYITIMWNNIKEDEKSQFDLKHYPIQETRGFKYDYTSILHYANWSEHAAIDIKKPIIVPKAYEPNMGQRIGLDSMDLEKVNLFYNCNPGSH